MVAGPAMTSHQCVGNAGSHLCCSRISTETSRKSGPFDVLQHYGGVPHQTGGWDQVILAQPTHNSSAQCLWEEKHNARSGIWTSPGHQHIQADGLSCLGQMLPMEWSIDCRLLDEDMSFVAHRGSICPIPGSSGGVYWRHVDPVERVGNDVCLATVQIPAVLARMRQWQAVTMIFLAPYRMTVSFMPELCQLSRNRLIPVGTDSQTPCT